MKIPSLHHLSGLKHYWPLGMIGLVCLGGWMHERHGREEKKQASLHVVLAGLTRSTEDQAEKTFANGDFHQTATLLEAIGSSPTARPEALLLRARSLECLGHFAQAAEAYTLASTALSAQLTVLRGRKFCQRMANERRPVDPRSREFLYRLHEELMQRGDAATARFIAEKLLPDIEPMRLSTAVLLRQLAREARLEPSTEKGRLNVTLHTLDARILDLLRNLKIGTLNVSGCGLDAAKILAHLDVHELDISFNKLSDLDGLHALPLRSLSLHDTRTVDIRRLAGMPLVELNLSHTAVSSLQPLGLSPLEKLNLAFTAVRSLESIKGLPLRELDLSHTRITNLSALAGMPLERLALNGTFVRDLTPLAGSQLKSLSLSGTAIKDISVLANMPLVELDLRGCELLGDIEALARCPQLERVFLPRHLKAAAAGLALAHLQVLGDEVRVASSGQSR